MDRLEIGFVGIVLTLVLIYADLTTCKPHLLGWPSDEALERPDNLV